MTNETKNALYSILDLIDSLGTISFLKLDVDNVNMIRKEILAIIGDNKNDNRDVTILDASHSELLGMLPMILLDNTKFPSPKDVLNFAEKCLDIEVKAYWIKRSKAELVGIIISEVYKQNPKQFNQFLKTWDAFTKHANNVEKKTNNSSNDEFIDTWFKFFDNYKVNK